MPPTLLLTQFINVALGIFATVAVIPLIAYAWPRRHEHGVKWFIMLCAAVGMTTFWYAIEALAGTDLTTYTTLSKFEYLSLTSIPVWWLGFALSLARPQQRISRRNLIALLIIPMLTSLLALTNDLHSLVWVLPRFEFVRGSPVYSPEYGVWFWVFVSYSYILMLVGSLLLLGRVRTQWRLYRIQAILILVGALLPWVSNILVVFDAINPWADIALNSLFLGCSMLLLAFAQFRLGLLSFLPFAYQTIFNNVPDGIIVLDLQNQILTVNKEAAHFITADVHTIVGKPIVNVFPTYAHYLQRLQGLKEFSDVILMDERYIALRITPLTDHSRQVIGRLLVMHDVTAEKQVELAQQRQDVFSATMLDIAAILSSTLETGKVLSLLLENVQRIIAHDASNIMVYDEATRTSFIRYTYGYSPEADAALRGRAFLMDDFQTLRMIAETRNPYVISQVKDFGDWQELPENRGVASYASAPIYVDDQLVGFLNLDSFTPNKMPSDIVIPLRLIAEQAATAFRNARLYEHTRSQASELQRRVASLTIIQQMNHDISLAPTHDRLLTIALDAMLRLSSATGGLVALALADHTLRRAIYYGEYNLPQLDQLLLQPRGILQQVMAERHPLLLRDTPLDSAMHNSHAQIALPLMTETDSGDASPLFGVILLETTQSDRFSSDRFNLLTIVADRLSVSLQNLSLLDVVRGRSAELEQLYRQVRDLEELKSDMIRVAAHDLKNPLNIVMSYTSMLRDMPEFAPLNPRDIYTSIHNAGRRMDDIIRDFLSLERIGRLANNLTLQSFDLVALVEKSEADYLAEAYARNQTLRYELPATTPLALGDPVLTYEALSNFLSNAVKYTPAGGSITVSLHQYDQHLRVSVGDNGIGIAAEAQGKLFSPFYRVITPETRGIEGTGMGLHLTKSIIERQNGRVVFESVAGKGSTFGFELPVSPAD